MNIFLSCVSKKLNYPAKAEDIYQSALFKKSLAYAKSLNPDHIYILSAKHKVLELDNIIEPYDETLNDMSVNEKKAWADEVIKQLKEKNINFDEQTIFLAGKNYTKYIEKYFTNYTNIYSQHSGIGYILQFLSNSVK